MAKLRKKKPHVVVKHRISITTEDEEFARQIYKTIDKYSPKDEDAPSTSNCVLCRGKLKKIVDVFKGRKIDAYKCQKCGESYLDPIMTEKILQSHKLTESGIPRVSPDAKGVAGLGTKTSKPASQNHAGKGRFTSSVSCKRCFDKDGATVPFVKDADELGYGMGDWYCPRCGFGTVVNQLLEAWQNADVTCRGHVDYEHKMKLRLKESFREILHGK